MHQGNRGPQRLQRSICPRCATAQPVRQFRHARMQVGPKEAAILIDGPVFVIYPVEHVLLQLWIGLDLSHQCIQAGMFCQGLFGKQRAVKQIAGAGLDVQHKHALHSVAFRGTLERLQHQWREGQRFCWQRFAQAEFDNSQAGGLANLAVNFRL